MMDCALICEQANGDTHLTLWLEERLEKVQGNILILTVGAR